MPHLEMLDDAERRLLCQLPFEVYFLIAGADGHVDRQELEGFFDGLQLGEKSDDPVVASFFADVRDRFDRYHDLAAARAEQGLDALVDGIRLGTDVASHRLPGESSQRLRRTLFWLARLIAEASGDGESHVSRVSDEEAAALERLALVLGVRE